MRQAAGRVPVPEWGKRRKLLPRGLRAEGVSLPGGKNANRFHCRLGPKRRHFGSEVDGL